MAHSMAEADLRDVLPRIEVPTLLLCGELDQRSPLQLAAELAARIPAAELVVIPGVGHISNAEAPETFNACVREFLWSWTVSADPNRPADRSNATGVQGRESLRQLTSGCPRPTRTPK
jgi:alpha-beta hydrolase superfamily lysophospholipase